MTFFWLTKRRSQDIEESKGALCPGPSRLHSWGPRLHNASVNLSCCFLKDFSSCDNSDSRRQVCSYMGAISCCFDGAVCLFKAIIKALYHSLEQQNEFQSRNYCPIIFRIIKASSARPLLPPSLPLPPPPSVCICSVSSVCMSHVVTLNSASRAGLFLRRRGCAETRMDLGVPVSFVLRLDFCSLLWPMQLGISLLWKISIGMPGREVRV